LQIVDTTTLREIALQAGRASGTSTPLTAFLSANQEERTYRDAARRALARMDVEVTGMDLTTSSNAHELIAAADIFIAIIGWRYGSIPESDPDSLSYVHREYRHSKEVGQPRLIFMIHPGTRPSPSGPVDAVERMRRFREELQQNESVSLFRTAEELEAQLMELVAQQRERRAVSPRAGLRRAFIVAVEDYPQNRGLAQHVPGVRQAAEMFCAALLERLGIQVDQVHMCLDTAATRENVVQQLLKVVNEARDQTAQFYFVFSGHSFRFPDEPDAEFLIMSDFVDSATTGSACLNLNEIQDRLAMSLGPGDHYYFVSSGSSNFIEVAAINVPAIGIRLEPSLWVGRPSTHFASTTDMGARSR
jgi:uncharacterized protein DUF4062